MSSAVAKPIGLAPFVQEAVKDKTRLYGQMETLFELNRRGAQRWESSASMGYFGMRPVTLPNFSDSFHQETCRLGGRLQTNLAFGTPSLKQSFENWEASTDASSHDSDEEEVHEEQEEEQQEEQEEEHDKVEDEAEDELKSQYEAQKAEFFTRVTANDPESHRVAAMKAVHQPIPGAKAGREEASVHEYLNYGKSKFGFGRK
jgi:hypothetical protein